MDLNPIIAQVYGNFWWLLPAALIIGFLKTPLFKGWAGEKLVDLSSRLMLSPSTYRRLSNVTLATPSGSTQIDHVIVSPYGIFVIETKHMKGWIYGRERQATWTQKLYKRSFKFQNPIRQNYGHVKALESLLQVPPDCIHSVVAFVGDCRFKTPMPDNVSKGIDFVRYIRSFRHRVFADAEVEALVAQIQKARLTANRATRAAHVAQLRARHAGSKEAGAPNQGPDRRA